MKRKTTRRIRKRAAKPKVTTNSPSRGFGQVGSKSSCWDDPTKVGKYERYYFDDLAANVGGSNSKFLEAWEVCGMALATHVCAGHEDVAKEMAGRMFDCRCRHVKPELFAK